jgi:hypothetical protein
MAFIFNEYDVEDMLLIASRNSAEMPNAWIAARSLDKLVAWTNENSDGWAYWAKPSNASTKLQELLRGRFASRWGERIQDDITDAELRKAMSPIKAFLTRQGIDHSEVFA